MPGRIARAGIYLLLGAAPLTPAAVALGLAILAEPTPGRVPALDFAPPRPRDTPSGGPAQRSRGAGPV
ncbi:hypothetical protein ABZ297_46190 [Nonomuraea sp. NPDC005983]|uniref:hypothetical protein n=1 Tax=Nonomuraea sp. NPDC005983 TaxID=3155595 RepID=UPI0033B8F679